MTSGTVAALPHPGALAGHACERSTSGDGPIDGLVARQPRRSIESLSQFFAGAPNSNRGGIRLRQSGGQCDRDPGNITRSHKAGRRGIDYVRYPAHLSRHDRDVGRHGLEKYHGRAFSPRAEQKRIEGGKETFSIRDCPAPEHAIRNSECLREIAQRRLFLSLSNHDQISVGTIESGKCFERDVEPFLE